MRGCENAVGRVPAVGLWGVGYVALANANLNTLSSDQLDESPLWFEFMRCTTDDMYKPVHNIKKVSEIFNISEIQVAKQ